jgi:predicted nuclease with TOPRIM domain
MEHNEQLKRITQRIQALLGKYDSCVKENEKLRKENEQLKSTRENQVARIQELEQKIAVLKTLTGKIDDGEKKELEKRINGYLKEIDRCISLLSQ